MKRLVYFFSLIVVISLSTGCQCPVEQQPRETYAEQFLAATLFHQQAAEMRALSYQAYNLATMQLEQAVKQSDDPSKLAIVLDLDETVLDNSPYQAEYILQNFNYPAGWAEWCRLAEAPALPGAVAFLENAVAHGVQVFYVSNRKDELREATKENFNKVGIPLQAEFHLMLRTAESGKENRRLAISGKYEIIMLIGDNLSDFHQVFDAQSTERRAALADSLKVEFGSRFIVIPNAMYGDWLQALHHHDNSLSSAEKSELFHQLLRGFDYEKPDQ